MQSVQETRTNVTKFRAAWFEHLSAPAVREIPEAGSMQDIKARLAAASGVAS